MLPKGSIAKIYDYYFNEPRYKDELMPALREFLDRPDLDMGGSLELSQGGIGLFNEWFLYNFKLANGKTVLADFVAENPLNISVDDMALYKDLLKTNVYSLYEVVSVDVEKGLMLKNLRTKKNVYVQERSLTYQVKPGGMSFLRVAKIDGHYEIVGADSFLIDGLIGGVIKKLIAKSDFELTPKFTNSLWQKNKK